MRRTIGGLFLVALVLVGSAGAGRFQLVGDTRPRHLAWTHAAQVPLPPATITLLRNRDAMYDPGSHTAMIPQAGKRGWTYADERLLLLHELGHAFDYTLMNRGDRVRFRKLAGTTCSWWQDPCSTPNVRCGCGQILDVPPGEMFAEEYAALALGLTRVPGGRRRTADVRLEPARGSRGRDARTHRGDRRSRTEAAPNGRVERRGRAPWRSPSSSAMAATSGCDRAQETTKPPDNQAVSLTGATGLEPATSGVTGRRSNQLNYAPGRRAV